MFVSGTSNEPKWFCLILHLFDTLHRQESKLLDLNWHILNLNYMWKVNNISGYFSMTSRSATLINTTLCVKCEANTRDNKNLSLNQTLNTEQSTPISRHARFELSFVIMLMNTVRQFVYFRCNFSSLFSFDSDNLSVLNVITYNISKWITKFYSRRSIFQTMLLTLIVIW